MVFSTAGAFTGIVSQNTSLFDTTTTQPTNLIQLQTVPSNPFVGELPTATGMVLPDRAMYDRLSHFPEDLYDLRPESHLTRFLKAILGESGMGALRKGYLLAQLQQSLTSTHFYDLDRFYGALFGARRGILGSLPINPMTDVATPDGWDEITQFDAIFRERIIKLAKAITLGGTPSGMQALAEALTGVECDIYEVWSMIDTSGSAAAGRTYANVEADFSTYGVMKTLTWSQIMGRIIFGNLGANARNEFIVRPKKVYNTSNPDDAIQRAEDIYGIQRVIQVLKPAFTLSSIDDRGIQVHQKVPIRSVSADSEFWEVITRVIPRQDLLTVYELLYRAYDKRAVPQGIERVPPRPPFSSSQGQQWSYVNETASVQGYTKPSTTTVITNYKNYDTVTFYDGTRIVYYPEFALVEYKNVHTMQATVDGSLIAHPYAGDRKVVATHG